MAERERQRPGHEGGGAGKAPPEPKRTPIPDTSQPIADLAQAVLGELAQDVTHAFGDVVVYVPAEQVVEACRRCRDDERLRMDYLRCLSGVDYVEYFEVVYHLFSISLRHTLALKVKLPHDQPKVATVTGVWLSADWHERELMEMYGITVVGHPDPRPLLLDEGVDERPLLKSHPLVPIGADRPGIIAGPGEMTGWIPGAWAVKPEAKKAIVEDGDGVAEA